MLVEAKPSYLIPTKFPDIHAVLSLLNIQLTLRYIQMIQVVTKTSSWMQKVIDSSGLSASFNWKKIKELFQFFKEPGEVEWTSVHTQDCS